MLDEHKSLEYEKLNPSRSVPLLIHHAGDKDVSIGQSVAALEYLEETFPSQRPLLPPSADPEGRAYVRALVNIVTSDIQPVTNRRIVNAVRELGGSRKRWAQQWYAEGLKAFESLIAREGGTYSYGDEVTLADVCLSAAMWNAATYEVDLEPFPLVRRISENLSKEPDIIQAHWKYQADCPDRERA